MSTGNPLTKCIGGCTNQTEFKDRCKPCLLKEVSSCRMTRMWLKLALDGQTSEQQISHLKASIFDINRIENIAMAGIGVIDWIQLPEGT